jgi:hypothetical protein
VLPARRKRPAETTTRERVRLAIPPAQATSGVLRKEWGFVSAMGLPPVHAEMEVIETTPHRGEIQVQPVRGEMKVLPTGKETLDLEEEERQRMQVVLSSIRVTGLALSVGAVGRRARP